MVPLGDYSEEREGTGRHGPSTVCEDWIGWAVSEASFATVASGWQNQLATRDMYLPLATWRAASESPELRHCVDLADNPALAETQHFTRT